jgi:hypothetical protein
MAGAVSAGAYTGGVIDYLLQTLDAWYAKKGQPGIPTHDISLDIISGASAGGITGGMAVLALFLENRYSVTPDKRNDEEYLKKNVFYNAWVNLTQDDMIPVLLDKSDIENNGKIVSFFNSDFIEKLARDTITVAPVCTTSPPSYINKDMELILTLSNLDGFTYKLRFSGEGEFTHVMKQHRDYAFFRLGEDYRNDGRIPLHLHRENVGLRELVEAAPATGAFPIGLAYRRFVRKNKYIADNRDLVFHREGLSQLVDISGRDPEDDYVTYNVDGGMLNNEPFDLTMKLMSGGRKMKPGEREFDSSIIMIDPFPSEDSITEETRVPKGFAAQAGEKAAGNRFPYNILQVARKVFASMRGELLFKGEDIVEAFSTDNFSRFMVAPRRREKISETRDKVYNGSIAIACGALGGFSGFFDKSFRRHDFFLGRVNCQSFLRNYFRVKLENGVPVNPLFAEGYSEKAIADFKFQDNAERKALEEDGKDPDSAPWYVPIIPDVHKGNTRYDEKPLEFPTYDLNRLDEHRPAILSRFKTVVRSFGSGFRYRLFLGIGFLFGSKSIYKALRKEVEDEFVKWKLAKKQDEEV